MMGGAMSAAQSKAKATDKTKAATQSKPPAGKPSAKKPPTAKRASQAPMKFGPRKDLGAPVDGFFAKQTPALRAILDPLRAAIDAAAPDATSAIKWGMPFYTLGGNTVCALAAFKAHVNLILPGPPGTYPDPDGLTEGDGKTGRHVKLRPGDPIPEAAIADWLRIAVARARG
jgi:hypothetical protein